MQAIANHNQQLVFQLLNQQALDNRVTVRPKSHDSRTGSEQLTWLDQLAPTPRAEHHPFGNGFRLARSTPLQLAAGHSTAEIVQLLITFGANPNYSDQRYAGYTPLQYACRNGRLESARVLLDSGANPDLHSQKGWGEHHPIHDAVKSNNFAVVALILDASRSAVNAQNTFKWSPLHYAVDAQPEIFDLLMDHGANINAIDQHGHSVLHTAIRAGSTMTVTKIMKQGDFDWESIHYQTDSSLCKRGTLLHDIARNAIIQLETAILLLAHGLNPTLTDSKGKTAADIAKKSGNSALSELLETAVIARGGTTGFRQISHHKQPFSLQTWSTHAIRRDVTLWRSATALLPRHIVTFVFGANWKHFQEINKFR